MNFLYNSIPQKLRDGGIDWVGDEFWVSLIRRDLYEPERRHEFLNDIPVVAIYSSAKLPPRIIELPEEREPEPGKRSDPVKYGFKPSALKFPYKYPDTISGFVVWRAVYDAIFPSSPSRSASDLMMYIDMIGGEVNGKEAESVLPAELKQEEYPVLLEFGDEWAFEL